MNATDALKAARAAGIVLRVDGEGLVLEAAAPPPAEVLDLLARYKPGVIALLSGLDDRSTDCREHGALFRHRALKGSAMTALSPNLMATKERLGEVCAILASGIIRHRQRDTEASAHEQNFGLHFPPAESGGANPPIRRAA